MSLKKLIAISALLVSEVHSAASWTRGPECGRDDNVCQWVGCQNARNTPNDYAIGYVKGGWELIAWTRFDNINVLCDSPDADNPGADCCRVSKFGSRCGAGEFKLLWCK
ncbi:hypothetical protein V8C37DRAFT_368132 [Trichoderma ceciliae]